MESDQAKQVRERERETMQNENRLRELRDSISIITFTL